MMRCFVVPFSFVPHNYPKNSLNHVIALKCTVPKTAWCCMSAEYFNSPVSTTSKTILYTYNVLLQLYREEMSTWFGLALQNTDIFDRHTVCRFTLVTGLLQVFKLMPYSLCVKYLDGHQTSLKWSTKCYTQQHTKKLLRMLL